MVGPNTLRSLDKLLELASAERRKLRLRRAAHIYAAVCSLAAHPGTSVAAADAGSADANQQAAADAVCRAVAALDSLGGSNPSHRAAADGAAADFEAAASSFRRQQQSASAAGGPLVPLALPLRGNVATDGDAPGRAVVELEALIGLVDCCRLLGRRENHADAVQRLQRQLKADKGQPHCATSAVMLMTLLDELSGERSQATGGARPRELAACCTQLVRALPLSEPRLWRALGAEWSGFGARCELRWQGGGSMHAADWVAPATLARLDTLSLEGLLQAALTLLSQGSSLPACTGCRHPFVALTVRSYFALGRAEEAAAALDLLERRTQPTVPPPSALWDDRADQLVNVIAQAIKGHRSLFGTILRDAESGDTFETASSDLG